MSNLLKDLNPQQQEGVTHTEGPLLILAGAGSGKTRVLTYRIAYLIEQGRAYPSQILAITFTNKAANEMKERVAQLVGPESNYMWVSTFHSMCLRFLRRDSEKIDYQKNFVIYDPIDQKSVLNDCIKELNISEKQFPIPNVIKSISSAKDKLIFPKEYLSQNQGNYYQERLGSIYQLYQEKLKKNNAMDFDDLIVKSIKLFQENPKVLEFYQNRFKYILVDEYQDTNYAQYKLVNMLSGGYRNLCVVGDDDQSIYGFRGADVENILSFEKDFPDAKVIKLEQNYRSSQRILNAANYVIQNNSRRKDKRLWTDNGKGNAIFIQGNDSEYKEGEFIAQEIEKCRKQENRNYKDFAILYRTNAQSRTLEDALRRAGIPYQIFGGLKFYSRLEIKDIIAYLTLLENPQDDVALKRIINTPKRGIGHVTMEKIQGYAEFKGEGLFNIILKIEEVPGISPGAKTKIKKFASMMASFNTMKEYLGLSDLIKKVLEDTGYLEMLEEGKLDKSDIRLENLEEFVSGATEFENNSEDTSLRAFLENISLVSDIDTLDPEEGSAVLMTLHNAKGLEFPVVFLTGMEEGMFPHSRSLLDYDEMEEERRLCYVGITRAMEKLYMTYAEERIIYGQPTSYLPSRFLKEIEDAAPEGLIVKSDREILTKRPLYKNNYSPRKTFKTEFYKPPAKKPMVKTSSEELVEGVKVKHNKWGIGTIVGKTKAKDDIFVSIAFPGIGIKKVSLSYASLEIVR
jgi:DNA helicase-2/ATP-dependent DNA helicase PcrA